MVHSSSGLGRRPLTAETRVRSPDALRKPAEMISAGFFMEINIQFANFSYIMILLSHILCDSNIIIYEKAVS